ncbi:unnamed protein product [Vicia faba]|uniref:Uncharacterized protein n=1 Tax=Vicia faba TaxID=3906 RepID=A0AAV0ZGS3_VICFA|nr:unnamed protein product [Vicia faba]
MATSSNSFEATSSHSSSSSSSSSPCVSSSVCPHLTLGSGSCSCTTQVGNKPKRGHQETNKNKINNVCLHLTLSLCCCLDDTQIIKKQKCVPQGTGASTSTTNSTCNVVAVGTNSDCSTNVGDPWMIKKVQTNSDLDDNCRLLLNNDLAKKWVVPVVDKAKAESDGVEVEVFDVDTGFPLSLTFKIRP